MDRKLYFLLLTLVCLFSALPLAAQAQGTPGQGAARANSDPLYQQVRQKSQTVEAFSGQVATVSGVVLRRDAATFKFNNGEIYFLSPVEGRTIAGVFVGDGEMTLVPPTDAERHTLAIFTDKPELTEHFSRLVMHFTDQTLAEIKKTPGVTMAASGGQAAQARDAYREIETRLRKQIHYNIDLRTLEDLDEPEAPGFFIAFPGGGQFNKLVFLMDPRGIPEVYPEEVAIESYSDTAGGIWTAFHRDSLYQAASQQAEENLTQRPKARKGFLVGLRHGLAGKRWPPQRCY